MNRQQLIERSEKWLRTYCHQESHGPNYESMLDALSYVHDGDDYFHFGEDASGSIPPEFWYHVEIVTGKKFEDPPIAFSCSC